MKPSESNEPLSADVPLVSSIVKRAKGLWGADARTPSATSLSVPNDRGIEGLHDREVDFNEVLKRAPGYFVENVKQLWHESGPKFPGFHAEQPDIHRRSRGTTHGETIVQYDFKSDENFKKWIRGADSDWNEGYSKCELYRSDRNTAIFQGTLSSKLVKDGKMKRAGWCSMKTIDRAAFNWRVRYDEWGDYSHFLIKVRGDGRMYKIMLWVQEFVDVSWGCSYSYPLHTHGGPYWQYERIPFSKFFLTFSMRIQDDQRKVDRFRINAISIVLMDKIEGDFKLEIDFMGATHDMTHKEKFAYEKYQLPVFTTHGF